jgi:hypothetical protein
MPKPPLLCKPLAGLGVYKEDLGLSRRIGPPEEYPPSSRTADPLFFDPCNTKPKTLLLHVDYRIYTKTMTSDERDESTKSYRNNRGVIS